MENELRNSGIDVIDDVPWGTHFCQFYKTKQDLIDILVPYFKAGLESNEFCMWVTSEPLMVAEVQGAMREAVEHFDGYLRRGQIEIIPYNEWYLLEGTFNGDRVLAGWVSKLEQALARGYAGLRRLTSNTFWLERNHWQAFTEYEAKVNNVIGQYQMLAICSYSLDKCDGAAVIDVVRNHQFALIKQEGRWDIIESVIYKQAKEALRQSKERYQSLFNNMTEGFALHEIILDDDGKPCDYRFIEVNGAFGQQTGLLPDKITGRTVKEVLPGVEDYWIETCGKVALTGEAVSFENFSASLGKWYEVYAYSPKRGFFATLFKDISKRRNMEEALRRNEQDLNRAQAVAHTGSWRLDTRDNQLSWSDETHRIFGIPKDTPLTYETFLSCVHPEDREYVGNKWKAALRSEPYDIEHRIIVDNKVKWVRERAELEFDSQGLLSGRFGTTQDITENKQIENDLRVKEFAVISAASGIAIADLNSIVTYMNPACLSLWDYEEEEMLGKPAASFFANKNEAGVGLKAVLEKGAWQGELKARRRDGSTFDVQVLANLVTDADGEPFCSMASFVDVTEKKQIHEALQREEQVRHAIMENTGAQLAYLDTRFNFVMVNSAYAEGSGHSEEELVGKNHFALFPNKENQTIFERVRDTGKPAVYHDKPFEFEDQPERGVTYWDWTLTPVKDSLGEVQGLVLSLIDTTAHKKVEDLKDSFIGMVSHELRTPLTVINGCLSTILTEWERLPSGEAQQLLRDATLECESLCHLVENLLELSRFQAQQLSLYKEPTDAMALVIDTLNKIKRQAQSHRFITSIPDELILMQSDPLRIERVLYNLLENAAKYSPPRSQIKVSVTLEPERLVISVHDQGRGLSLAEQAKLFKPFWRLEEARPDRARGAGLGLVVCQVLVEAHGGEIWVKSKKGKGSTFFFSLPYIKGTDASKVRLRKTK